MSTGRRPTLSQYDTADLDDYEVMQSGTWDKGRDSARRLQGAPKMDLKVLGGELGSRDGKPLCWCGQPAGHPYEGPHPPAPRQPSPPALGHRCLFSEVPGEHVGRVVVRVCVFCGRPGDLTEEEAERERAFLDRVERVRQGLL